MRRFLAIMLAAVLPLSLLGQDPGIHSIEINCFLDHDGSADITEVWDVTTTSGTEWYLVKGNLGDMEISDFEVKDETGRAFVPVDSWNTSLSIEEKAGKCGMLHIRNGYELCWGMGSYGDHVYTARYRVTNFVKSMEDCDMIHYQFVSPGLSSSPEQVRVVIRSYSDAFDASNTEVHGFGYDGDCRVAGGAVVAEGKDLDNDHSVIVMARFSKGIFSPTSSVDKTFDEVFEEAQSDDDEDLGTILAVVFGALATFIGLVTLIVRGSRKSVFGVSSLSYIDPSRTVPFGGDVVKSYYVLQRAGIVSSPTYVSAMVLKFVKAGALTLGEDQDGKLLISFNETPDLEGLYNCERVLLGMLKKAAGGAAVLRDRDFDKWASRHSKETSKWTGMVQKEGEAALMADGSLDAKKSFTEIGKMRAQEVASYKKYLEGTGLDEEKSMDRTVKDSMVFGALFGLTRQMKRLYRNDTEWWLIYYLLVCNSHMSSSVGAAAQSHSGSTGTSIHGGGGFSGGGFGGGAR